MGRRLGESKSTLVVMNLLKGSRTGVVVFLIMIFTTTSCSTTKEMRRANRATRKLEKLTMRFPELLQRDTIRDTIPAIVTDVRLDTVLLKADTITVQKDRLRVRVITERDTVRITGECFGDIIYVPVEIPVEKIQPVQYKPMPLKWWQITLMVFGGGFILALFYKITS